MSVRRLLRKITTRVLASTAVVLVCTSCGVGVAESLARRSGGECYVDCNGERVCNRDTGFCEVDPCAKGCGPGRHCEVIAVGKHRCAPDTFRVAEVCPDGRVRNAATGLCEVGADLCVKVTCAPGRYCQVNRGQPLCEPLPRELTVQ